MYKTRKISFTLMDIGVYYRLNCGVAGVWVIYKRSLVPRTQSF